jgi:hypothetical protein
MDMAGFFIQQRSALSADTPAMLNCDFQVPFNPCLKRRSVPIDQLILPRLLWFYLPQLLLISGNPSALMVGSADR